MMFHYIFQIKIDSTTSSFHSWGPEWGFQSLFHSSLTTYLLSSSIPGSTEGLCSTFREFWKTQREVPQSLAFLFFSTLSARGWWMVIQPTQETYKKKVGHLLIPDKKPYGQRQNYRKKKVGKKGRAPTAACFSIINYSCKKWGKKKNDICNISHCVKITFYNSFFLSIIPLSCIFWGKPMILDCL